VDRSDRARTQLLVVEDDAAMREFVHESLAEEGYRVDVAPGGKAGVDRVRAGGIDLVITDVKMPDMDGLDMLSEIRALGEGSPPHVIVVTAFGSIETAKRAIKLGAHDYITKPFEIEDLLVAVEKALDERTLRREVARLRKEVARPYRFENIIGKSPPMQDVFALIRRLSASSVNVLITGESGTGKELVARALHFNSPRIKKSFVAVNCAAIPDTLLESELFGYKRGAFTDARTDRPGMFIEADGGTIFLDEIGDLTPPLQAKLLRVLQEKEVRPLGAARSEKVDVRVLSATNRDLVQRMREGAFREDLFYRLNVIEVVLPPLRDRAEDVLPLSEHFLQEAASRTGKRIVGFTQPALKILLAYPWPGNVRELENVVERAVALAEGDQIGPDDLPPQVRERRSTDVLAGALARGLTLAELEREYINRVLQAEGGNKTRAAQRLGLDRKTLYRKLEEYGRPGDLEPQQSENTARIEVDVSDTSEEIEPDLPRSESTMPIPKVEATAPIPRVDPSEDDE
jgi:two-component system response regulator PilR (NtrC family)/two-component system response regulator HydG